MNTKDNIEWLKSLKREIGQAQYRCLWHFEQAIDETIKNLEPLAKPHGRLIDESSLIMDVLKSCGKEDVSVVGLIDRQPTIIKAED